MTEVRPQQQQPRNVTAKDISPERLKYLRAPNPAALSRFLKVSGGAPTSTTTTYAGSGGVSTTNATSTNPPQSSATFTSTTSSKSRQKGSFTSEVFATTKYLDIPPRFKLYSDYASSSLIEHSSDIPESWRPRKDPPLLTSTTSATPTSQPSFYGSTALKSTKELWNSAMRMTAPAGATEWAFTSSPSSPATAAAAVAQAQPPTATTTTTTTPAPTPSRDASKVLVVHAPHLSGSRVLQPELQLREMDSSLLQEGCMLPSQRRKKHEFELAQMRALQSLHHARAAKNVLDRQLATKYRNGVLGVDVDDEVLSSNLNSTRGQVLAQKQQALLDKRREFILRNTVKPGSGDFMLLRHTCHNMPDFNPPPSTKFLQSKRRCEGLAPQDTFSIRNMLRSGALPQGRNRMAVLTFQDGRGRGFNILSGAIDSRVAKNPYDGSSSRSSTLPPISDPTAGGADTGDL